YVKMFKFKSKHYHKRFGLYWHFTWAMWDKYDKYFEHDIATDFVPVVQFNTALKFQNKD
ncbi:hypothetical protein ABEB36_008776, partial [Hypothenemus hampei]